MRSDYQQLLDATIYHLEQLKTRGERFIEVSPEAVRLLSQFRTRALASPPPARSSPLAAASPASAGPRAGLSPITPELTSPELPKPVVALSAAGIPPLIPATDTPNLSSQAKTRAFAELRERALACTKCPHLASSRKNVVFGVGDINGSLMFVGEAPGADEDTQGEPFVGAAGQLLTRIINAMGLSREAVYIANILKCRPDTPGQSSGNRKPTPEEMETCIPYLHAQIDLIQPKAIVALGGTAMEGLLGLTGISKLRGRWQTYRGIPLMPTFHPSFLLRPENAGKKRLVWEDMLAVMGHLGMPIDERQQRFFQPAASRPD